MAVVDELRAISTFIKAAELGSFNQAAQAQGTTAQAVSKSVRQLEQHLGVRLFHRTTRKSTLTEDGRRLLDSVRDSLFALTDAVRQVREAAREDEGLIRIGAGGAVGRKLLLPLAAEFQRHHPGIDLDLVLEEGDVLYLPRGHPHVAETTDRASAHLTVGILAITWHRLVRRAIDEAVDGGWLRGSVPLGLLSPPGTVPQDDDAGRRARPDLGALDLDLGSLPVRRWIAREIWRRQAATRLRPREAVDPSLADRCLEVAPGPLLGLSRDGDRSLLFLGDRTLSQIGRAHV